MERIKTGIKGFDNLVEGGLPKGKTILISGAPGTFKTLFALQYLFNGAEKCGEKGIYVSFEDEKSSIISQAMQFGWDLKKLEDKGMLRIISYPVRSIKESTVEEATKLAKRFKAKRVVIDSLSALAINAPTTHNKVTELTDISIMRFIYEFITDLRKAEGVTTLIISQAVQSGLSRDTVSEFICDGAILLKLESMMGDFTRSLTIMKMRETSHSTDVHPVEITPKGIVVHKMD